MRQIAETGIELAVAMGQPEEWILGVGRWELERAVRIGMWRGVVLSVRQTMGIRWVMKETRRMQYPFRAGQGVGAALQVLEAAKAGMECSEGR